MVYHSFFFTHFTNSHTVQSFRIDFYKQKLTIKSNTMAQNDQTPMFSVIVFMNSHIFKPVYEKKKQIPGFSH
jgi:hypothetical protein